MMDALASRLTAARRLVVKVGTSVLTAPGGDQLSPARVRAIAAQVAQTHRTHREVIVVTSGAIAAGMQILGYRKRPTALPRLQAASAVGQGRLMQLYESAFAAEGFHAAQLLLTREDLQGPRCRNVQATLATLLAAGVIPVINENDSVSTDEICVGDNDRLAAHVAVLARADLLVVLSDVAGLCERLPDRARPGRVIPLVQTITPAIKRWARGTLKDTSTGGMQTKVLAAQITTAAGIPLVITDGRQARALAALVLDGERRGTVFLPQRHADRQAGGRR